MINPNLKEEKKLRNKGYKVVAGLDEAGRGPLAGPVVAAAVILGYGKNNIKGVKDSKQLTPEQRESLYKVLINNKDIKWGIGIVSEKVIDKINILQATKTAMEKAIKKMQPDFLLLDGNFKIKSEIPQKSVIKGDQKVMSIAMASIIAKVTRDRLMQKYHKKYPLYGFDRHKGYPTKAHFANLKKFGPCKIHRKTFYPVNRVISG